MCVLRIAKMLLLKFYPIPPGWSWKPASCKLWVGALRRGNLRGWRLWSLKTTQLPGTQLDVCRRYRREGGAWITDTTPLLVLRRKVLCADVILVPFFYRIEQAGKEAYVLGLSSFHIPSIGAACVCFLELLGLDSLKLRVDMKAANIILSYKCRKEDAQYSFIRESLGNVPVLCVAFVKGEE